MDSNTNEIVFEFPPYLRVYKDGRVERLLPSEFVPTSDDPQDTVRTKDVIIQPDTGVSVRLYVPKLADTRRKLPLLIYIHGGAFCLGSASNPKFNHFVTSLVEKANVVAVSVDYRLAPEHQLPAAYDDASAAFQWVVSHASGKGNEPWLNDYADFESVFLGGESAGTNIVSDVAIRAGDTELPGVKIDGIFLVHPYFGTKEVDKMYKFFCPTSSGCEDDPRLNPAIDPRLPHMAGRRVLICLAEKDFLIEGGRTYYERLKKSEWNGEVEVMETEGEGHCFHLTNPTCEKAKGLMKRVVSFINQDHLEGSPS